MTKRHDIPALERAFNAARNLVAPPVTQLKPKPQLQLPGGFEVLEESDSAAAAAFADTVLDTQTGAAATTAETETKRREPTALDRLFTVLRYRRGHGSPGEKAFIHNVLVPFFEKSNYIWRRAGPVGTPELQNFILIVPTPLGEPESKTLFSCHIDTTHNKTDKELVQSLSIDPALGHVFLQHKDRGGCLGADNGAGVWILMEMIRERVPGTYIFHRGEEVGCLGSKWLADNEQVFLRKFNYAVAFDRKGKVDVITHQRSGRTCSQAFALKLAERLNFEGVDMKYTPSDAGLWTDTASYTRQIEECTNVSVGYDNAHGPNEHLDYNHAAQLLEACLHIDWAALPVERNVNDPAHEPWRPDVQNWKGSREFNNGHSYFGHDMYDDDDEWQGRSWQPSTHAATPASASAPPPTKPQVNVKAAPAAAKFQAYVPHQACDFEKFSSAELQEWIECNDSTEIANIISDLIDEVVGLRSRLQYRLNLDSRDRCNSSNFP